MMNWMKHMSEAIEYIEENLTEYIDYEEASRIACCSVSYFQRMFSYITGVTISEYIRRRKMTLAGLELKQTHNKIITIAHKYGYTSPTAFTRAFISVHGISPSQAKEKQSQLHSYSPIKFNIQIVGGENLKYRIEEKKAMRCIGFRIPLPSDVDKAMMIVPAFWEQIKLDTLFEELLKLSSDSNIYGITDASDTPNIHYYIAVNTAAELPDRMFELSIPKSNRVIFENDGLFKETVQQTFRRFLLEWLPFSKYTYEGSTDIEVYPIHNMTTQTGHSEIWITIKEEKNDI